MRRTPALALWLSLLLSMPLGLHPGSSAAGEVPERADIPARYRWDLAPMYASAEAWEADAEAFLRDIPEMERYRGRLAESGETLLAALRTLEGLSRRLAHLYVYAGLKSNEDQRVSENSARFSQARALDARFNEAVAFFTPELLAAPPERLEALLAGAGDLAVYRHYLEEQTRLRNHTLSEREERLLAAASDPLNRFHTVFDALNDADLDFGEIRDEAGRAVELTRARYGVFLRSPDRRVRRDAWVALFSAYEKMGHTLAANYEGHVRGRVFNARARGYDSALQAATYANAIPQEVYTNLVGVAREKAGSLQRYLEVRRRALGLETLEVWDLYAPTVAPVLDHLEWEEAKRLVARALSPLGEEYLALYWRGFEERWVDALESRGKRSGAYSWGSYTSRPYLSMNYAGTLSDVTTLAHEYGHSLHAWLANSSQPYVYAGRRTFIAEVASMTNEAILFQKMLAEARTPGERASLLENYLDNFRAGFFRQASFADFELQAHQRVETGDALTKESLNDLYAEVFAAYHGDAVHAHPLNASEWSRIPHFLRTDNFYVYQYATSIVAATALARRILEEGAPAREQFLDMLRAGSSDYPIELLRKAGVDMTTPQPVYEALEVFDGLVDEFEAALGASG